MMTVIRFDTDLGGQAYPFLPTELRWEIVSRRFKTKEALAQIFDAHTPTLRWVKDNKVLDLAVPDMDTVTFLDRSGLRLSMAKGGYVLSKRLSRVMRPFRYAAFFETAEVAIDYNEDLCSRLWDGAGLISRGLVQRLADTLFPVPGSGSRLEARQRRELLSAKRFEITTLHAEGQDKGHVLVVDDPATGSGQLLPFDLMFPAGSAKTELSLTDGRAFVGLQPVHSTDQMCVDIQSLINLYPFFKPEHLLAWMQAESGLFLEGIQSGRLAAVLNRLYEAESGADLASLSNWHVGEFIASGGDPLWFAGLVKAVARQHLNRLGSRADKLRCPIPGGRTYIFPAAVGERIVPPGQVELDPATATAWVNDEDWLDYIVDVLGGCDGDDAVWVFPFADLDEDGAHKLLLWRSPNQLGEYVVLRPTDASHEISWAIPDGGTLRWPQMKSRLLPDRIDSANYRYGSLKETSDSMTSASYSISALRSTIERAAANRGVLGGYCNVLMLCKALYGRLPDHLPATLEDVIDGSVKTGLDLTPVRRWNQMALQRMVTHGRQNGNRALPEALLPRLPIWLRAQAAVAKTHWLDTLAEVMAGHREQFWIDVEALATEACPPLELFEHGRDWLAVGKELRTAYSRIMRQAVEDDLDVGEATFAAARAASEAFLARWPKEQRHRVLLGAAAYLYAHGPQGGAPVRDALIWQLGAPQPDGGRQPGIAQLMIQALRQIGLLGEPVWTREGALLHYAEAPRPRQAGIPIRINYVWFNWLRAIRPETPARMGDIPRAEREQAKACIADFVHRRFPGQLLTTQVTDHNRVVTRTAEGNLFGYVQRDHELAAIRHDQWKIAWANVVDGDVHAILEPVTA